MNIDRFLEKLRKDFPEYAIRVTEVEKFPKNYLGISFEKASNGMRGGPVFPVGMLIQMYVEKDYESVRAFISKILDEGPKEEWGAMVRNYADYSYIKKHLFLSVVNAIWGSDLLKKVPHRIMADLALVVRVKVHENSSVLVKREILETWGISEEELFEDAVKAAVEQNPASAVPLAEMLGVIGMDEGIHVGLTKEGMFGAASVFYPGFLDEVSRKLGGNYYVLPSSIHEVLFMKESIAQEMGIDGLNNMIRSINNNQVDEADRLSNHCYYYNGHSLVDPLKDDEFSDADKAISRILNDQDIVAASSITVLKVEPGKKAELIQIEDKLEAYQEAVGGLIENLYPFDGVALVCNEEGKVRDLPMNRTVYDEEGEVADVIRGTFLIVGTSETGNRSLTEDEIREAKKMFGKPEFFREEAAFAAN